ncbi:IucC family-domain-containing protein [Gloeopeniophorella convolvens]|nr:IucC family-domain-containing protein [Gloeopeniophorella convolvens]
MAHTHSSERAAFATISRLLACLVTESLVRGFYVPLPWSDGVGFCIVLLKPSLEVGPHGHSSPSPESLLAVIALRHVPVLKSSNSNLPHLKEIALLDPFDMFPLVLEVAEMQQKKSVYHQSDENRFLSMAAGGLLSLGWSSSVVGRLVKCTNPTTVWKRVASAINVAPSTSDGIIQELESSILWQTYGYDHPPPAPTLQSTNIEWEQSIVEGHPTYPFHRARTSMAPTPDLTPGGYDLYFPRVRLALLPRSSMKLSGDYDSLIEPICRAAAHNAGKPIEIDDGYVIIPVHELQTYHILETFKEAIILPEEFSIPGRAQQSLRSVVLPGIDCGIVLKLSLGIKLTSGYRFLMPSVAIFSVRLSETVIPALHINHEFLTIAREPASAVHTDDRDLARCAVIFRKNLECRHEFRGERHIVCTSLVESGHAGTDGDVSSVVRVFRLDTEQKRIEWLDRFVRIFFAAMLPPLLENGVAFEAHPQNCVARFELAEPHHLLGFIVRDMEGMRFHPPTVKASTGIDASDAVHHSEQLEGLYKRAYQTMIHNHLQRLIRVLGLHYNGKGWMLVRTRLREVIPPGHTLEHVWLREGADTVLAKSFMRMRCSGSIVTPQYTPVPNLILYEGVRREDLPDASAIQQGL